MTTIRERLSNPFILRDLPWLDVKFQLEAAAAALRARGADAVRRAETRWRIADWTRGSPIPDEDRNAAAAAYAAGEWRLAITLACRSLGTANRVRRAVIDLTPKQLRSRIAQDRLRAATRVGAPGRQKKRAPAR